MTKIYFGVLLLGVALFSGCGSTVDNSEVQYRSDGKVYLLNKSKPFSGTVEGYYDNKQLDFSEEYSDGVLDGERKAFYNTGAKRFLEYYDNGVLDGEQTVWFGNGDIKIKGEWENGKKVGKWQEFDVEAAYPFLESHLLGCIEKGEYKKYKREGEWTRKCVLTLGVGLQTIETCKYEYKDGKGKKIKCETKNIGI